MIVETEREAEPLSQVPGQRLHSHRLGGVVTGVKHIDAELNRVEVGVVRPFAGDESVHAFVGGQFRYLGPMKALHPPGEKSDPVLDAVAELRNKDREAYFKDGKLPEDI